MIEICERNRFTRFFGYDHRDFLMLARWMRWFEQTGVEYRLHKMEDGPNNGKYAVYREGLEESDVTTTATQNA